MKKQMRDKKLVVLGALLAGLLWMNAQPVLAQVEQCTGPQPTTCVPLNGGGSSAATPFMTQVPLNLLDQSPQLPIHYVNGAITGPPAFGATKLHVWTGTRGGVPTILRYSTTSSSDGILKLQQVMSNSLSNMTYLDHTTLTGCTAAGLLTRASDSKQYYERTGCTATTVQPMTMGMADVAGSSFHQTGPITTSVKPLDQSQLTSTQAAIVPWSLTVGEHVKKNVGGTLVPVTGLSRTEAEAIFSRSVTDWTQLGLVTDVTSPGTPDATSPITLCLRVAGSGSKASLDENVMKDATETPIGSTDLSQAADGVYFGSSTQDVQDCLRGNNTTTPVRPAHPRGIGYLDSDQAAVSSPAYPVALAGFLANDTSLTDAKRNIKCGLYLYWAGERMNVRNFADPGITAAITALGSAFITDASTAASIALLPAGAFWVASSDMFVLKNADGGPVIWKAGAHPTCAQ